MSEDASPAESRRAEVPRSSERTSAVIEGLVERWVGIIRRAAARYRISGADSDELTQDIRLRLWRMLEREGESAAISPGYVYRAAVSAAIDLVRRRRVERHERRVPLELVADELVDTGAIDTQETDLVAALERALAQVPASRRPAVRLHLRGHHLDEIANIMGWTQGKARNLLYRGLTDLRENLKQAGGRD